MLYDAACHANLQSVIRYPYPIIRGMVENDIRIYLYLQKFTDSCKYLSAVPFLRTSHAQLLLLELLTQKIESNSNDVFSAL